MKLLFVINNIQEAYYEYENTGSMPAVKKRSVEIELTDEQVRKIGIRNIGYSSRTPHNRDYRISIFVIRRRSTGR
jgi:hypothetical protein